MTTPMGSREMQARQLVLAAGTLDVWQAKFDLYRTTLDSCQCPDTIYRHVICKHRIALGLLKARKEME